MTDLPPPPFGFAEESHTHYRSQIHDMVRWAGIGHWEFHIDTGSFLISPEFLASYGFQTEVSRPITIERWTELIHPDDVPLVQTVLNSVIAGHVDVLDITYRLKIPSGEWRYLRSRGGRDESLPTGQQMSKIVGTSQDVTDLSVAQITLQRYERLHVAVNNVAQILLTASSGNFDQSILEALQILGEATEVDRVYIWKNESIDGELFCTQIYEWSPNAVAQQGNEFTVGIKYSESIPTWEERFIAGECVNDIVRNMPLAEQNQLSPQGIISILVSPLKLQGKFWGFIGFDDCHKERIWDNTEASILKSGGILITSAIQQRWAEIELMAERKTLDWIIENSPIAIIATQEGKISRLNKRANELFAFSKGTMASDISRKVVEGNNDIFNYDITDDIHRSGVFAQREFRFPCIDGVTRDFLMTTIPFRPNDYHHLISWIIDITDLKETERALIQSRDKAEIATKAKSDFLATMSHEIRTPMNAILGMIYLCLQTKLDAKQHDYLHKAQSAANSLLGIINDVLDFSKIEAGKIELETIPFSLKRTIDDVMSIMEESAVHKGVNLIAKVDSQTCDRLVGDPFRLRQILFNLIGNAIKFTSHGGVILTVRQDDLPLQENSKEDSNKTRITFEVKDTGIGLKPEQMETIFESFSQADGSTTRKYGGTGLGLAIVKSLVELMKGMIKVSSVPGQGTTFSFTVVFAVSHSDSGIYSSVSLLGKRRVLLVDDNADDLEILTNLLQSFQMNVSCAHSGASALEKLIEASQLRSPFELVVIDWRMPRMDGVEVIRSIRLNESIIPPHILVVSAYDRHECLQQVQGLHVANVLVKPIQPDELKAALKAAFQEDVTKKINEVRADIRGAKVLLAEDNKINQMVASELLKMLNIDVTVANNGKEAVEAVKEKKFDLILMDIQMPEMDGLTATREIRKLNLPDIDKLPILAMTANAMDTDYQKSLEMGMNDHLTKPIDPVKLHIALEKWIKK